MKGIILAGGSGSRLYPMTYPVCKQLLPIYNKPMIYYPLSTLMLAGIREILIISTPEDTPRFENIFGDGSRFGLKMEYAVQTAPRGLADAFIVGREFIGNDSVCLILGDNVFYGDGLSRLLKNAVQSNAGATVFGYYVQDPERYGVVEFDAEFRAVSIEEKPKKPKSNYAVVGLYFYNNEVVSIASSIKPSARGEIEITDVNRTYLEAGKLDVQLLGRGYAWLDTGTYDSLLSASNFIATIETRQGLMVGCLEEIACKQKWITKEMLLDSARKLEKTDYGQYLFHIAEHGGL